MRKSFGEVIRNGRTALGMSLSELARRCNLSVAYVCQIETGVKVPSDKSSWATVAALSEELGLDIEEMYDLIAVQTGRIPMDVQNLAACKLTARTARALRQCAKEYMKTL